MKKDKQKSKQLQTLLKKDLRLLFRKRVAIVVFGGPFLLMFILIGLPSLFTSQQKMTLLVCSDDQSYLGVDVGDSVVANITAYYSLDETVDVQTVSNFSAVKNTDNFGIYIPSNFSYLVISDTSSPTYFTVDATQSLFSSSIFSVSTDKISSSTNNILCTLDICSTSSS